MAPPRAPVCICASKRLNLSPAELCPIRFSETMWPEEMAYLPEPPFLRLMMPTL